MNNKSSSYIKLGEMFDENGIRSDLWIEWVHDNPNNPNCCPICKVLDNCWFLYNKMPLQPQHPNCHCGVKPISNPVPHKNARASCPINKFIGYIWGEIYKENGKDKFYEEMGFSVDDSQSLAKELERQAVEKYCKGEYTLGVLNEQGQRINIVVELKGKLETRRFGTGWMVRPHGLITNTTPLGSNKKYERI